MLISFVLLGTYEFMSFFQTELAIDTNIVVANTHTVVANTNAVVANTHTVVEDTHAVVADTHTAVADTRVIVADTHTVVGDTHTAVADTRTMVSDIHRIVLTGQEVSSGKNRSVGAACHLLTVDFLPSPRLKPGQNTEYYQIPRLKFS